MTAMYEQARRRTTQDRQKQRDPDYDIEKDWASVDRDLLKRVTTRQLQETCRRDWKDKAEGKGPQ